MKRHLPTLSGVLFCFLTLVSHSSGQAILLHDNLDPPWDTHGGTIGPRPSSSIEDRFFAQEFVSLGASSVTMAEVLMQQVGSPTGKLHFDIYDKQNGKPNSSLGRVGSIDLATLASQPNVVTLEGSVEIEPDQSYFFVADMIDTIIRNRDNSFRLGMRTADDGTNGVSRTLVSLPGQSTNFATLGDFIPGVNYLTMRLTGEMAAILGDFNQNGLLDAADINQLSEQVAAGSDLVEFDVNGDGAISSLDREFWISDLAGTFAGDADLDRHVAFPDFLALADHFGTEGGWESGDFDGNGTVEFLDFLILSQNYDSRAAKVASVPEPANPFPFCLAVLGVIGQRRVRKQPRS